MVTVNWHFFKHQPAVESCGKHRSCEWQAGKTDQGVLVYCHGNIGRSSHSRNCCYRDPTDSYAEGWVWGWGVWIVWYKPTFLGPAGIVCLVWPWLISTTEAPYWFSHLSLLLGATWDWSLASETQVLIYWLVLEKAVFHIKAAHMEGAMPFPFSSFFEPGWVSWTSS